MIDLPVKMKIDQEIDEVVARVRANYPGWKPRQRRLGEDLKREPLLRGRLDAMLAGDVARLRNEIRDLKDCKRAREFHIECLNERLWPDTYDHLRRLPGMYERQALDDAEFEECCRAVEDKGVVPYPPIDPMEFADPAEIRQEAIQRLTRKWLEELPDKTKPSLQEWHRAVTLLHQLLLLEAIMKAVPVTLSRRLWLTLCHLWRLRG